MTATYELTGLDRRAFARLTAMAWADTELFDRYHGNPGAVLAEFGIALPPGAKPPAMPIPVEAGIDLESLELSAGGALATMGTVSCPSLPAPAHHS